MAELSKRQERILAIIAKAYIASGTPVGSKAVQGEMETKVSSATIRNDMATLVDKGLLTQAHTSAGRAPTASGYRYYVDHLMQEHTLSKLSKQRINAALSPAWGDTSAILLRATELLASTTNMAVISTTPLSKETRIQHIEIVPLGSKKAMIVLLSTSGILKSRLARTSEPLTTSHMTLFYSLVDDYFLGKTMSDVHTVQLQTLVASLGEHSLTMVPLLTTVLDLVSEVSETQVHLKGETNLLTRNDAGHDLAPLLSFLQRPHPLEHLVLSASENNDDGILICIGTENRYKELSKSSVVLATYSMAKSTYGTLGIIGPTRMDYAQMVAYLDYLSHMVGKFLEEALED